MKFEDLSKLLRQPDVQQAILGDYNGAFSIGVALDPNDESQYAIRVRIEGSDADSVLREYKTDGERFPVIVNTSFCAPVPVDRNQ